MDGNDLDSDARTPRRKHRLDVSPDDFTRVKKHLAGRGFCVDALDALARQIGCPRPAVAAILAQLCEEQVDAVRRSSDEVKLRHAELLDRAAVLTLGAIERGEVPGHSLAPTVRFVVGTLRESRSLLLDVARPAALAPAGLDAPP